MSKSKTPAVQTRAKATATARKLGGFRRCGKRHELEWVKWPAGTFTEDQLKVLEADERVELRPVDEEEGDDTVVVQVPTNTSDELPADFDQLVLDAMADLPSDGFTNSGKPNTSALEALLKTRGHAFQVSAANRDRLWGPLELKIMADEEAANTRKNSQADS